MLYYPQIDKAFWQGGAACGSLYNGNCGFGCGRTADVSKHTGILSAVSDGKGAPIFCGGYSGGSDFSAGALGTGGGAKWAENP